MEHEQLTQIRFLSKRLFGALYRLEVIAFIEQADAFNLTELSSRMGTPPSLSSLQKELKLLSAIGMLDEQSQVGGMREVYYLARPNPMWQAAKDLCASITPVDKNQGLASTQMKRS